MVIYKQWQWIVWQFRKKKLRLSSAIGHFTEKNIEDEQRKWKDAILLSNAIITLARRNNHLWNVTRLQRGSRRCRGLHVLYNTHWELNDRWLPFISHGTISRFYTILHHIFFFFYPRRSENADLTLIVCRSMGSENHWYLLRRYSRYYRFARNKR